MVLCSGKVYVDLVTSERAQDREPTSRSAASSSSTRSRGVALREVLDGYPSLRDVVWLQEEPENMGAWEFVRPLLEELIGDRWPLRYIGRARSSSPSEGSAAWHQLNQTALVEQAFDLGVARPVRRRGRPWSFPSRSDTRHR